MAVCPKADSMNEAEDRRLRDWFLAEPRQMRAVSEDIWSKIVNQNQRGVHQQRLFESARAIVDGAIAFAIGHILTR